MWTRKQRDGPSLLPSMCSRCSPLPGPKRPTVPEAPVQMNISTCRQNLHIINKNISYTHIPLISLLWNHQLDDWTTLKVRKLSSSPRGPPSFLPTCWTYAITLKYEGWICHPTLPSTRWPFRYPAFIFLQTILSFQLALLVASRMSSMRYIHPSNQEIMVCNGAPTG